MKSFKWLIVALLLQPLASVTMASAAPVDDGMVAVDRVIEQSSPCNPRLKTCK